MRSHEVRSRCSHLFLLYAPRISATMSLIHRGVSCSIEVSVSRRSDQTVDNNKFSVTACGKTLIKQSIDNGNNNSAVFYVNFPDDIFDGRYEVLFFVLFDNIHIIAAGLENIRYFTYCLPIFRID